MSEQQLKNESIYIEANEQQLHLKRYFISPDGIPVFMLHGSIENGKIFYSKNHKGLAPFLARNGYDVFVADLSGRGESKPAITRFAKQGQTDAITKEIPAFINYIISIKGNTPQHWIAHSWGGVLLSSFLARFPEQTPPISSLVFFGTKRVIHVNHFEKLIKVNLFWNLFARVLAKLYGYLPTQKFGVGSDNETRQFHRDVVKWCNPSEWRDTVDGFDYAAAVKKITLPPLLHFVGSQDSYLGHPQDVEAFAREMFAVDSEIMILNDQNSKRNYGHIDILTHPQAESDHFQKLLHWLNSKNNKKLTST